MVIPSAVTTCAPAIPRRRNKHSDNCIKLLYVGNIDLARQFEILLKAVSNITRSGIDVSLDIYHTSFRPVELTRLKTSLDSMGLRDIVKVREPIKHSELITLFQRYDAGISIYSTNGCFQFNSPVKTLEYISHRLPWIGSDIFEHNRILSIEKTGMVFASIFELENHIKNVKKSKFTYHRIDNYIGLDSVAEIFKKELIRHLDS